MINEEISNNLSVRWPRSFRILWIASLNVQFIVPSHDVPIIIGHPPNFSIISLNASTSLVSDWPIYDEIEVLTYIHRHTPHVQMKSCGKFNNGTHCNDSSRFWIIFVTAHTKRSYIDHLDHWAEHRLDCRWRLGFLWMSQRQRLHRAHKHLVERFRKQNHKNLCMVVR